ncbi:TonB-dependent receptor [Sphingopyxis sp.]|uniref:TonB-dependent receptor n=1 Tax=Sphingopyxis sp. TaxID=1908224 RepID=UPI003D0F9200
MLKPFLCSQTAIAALLLGASPALAQEQADAVANDDDIVVTAQKREERLQDVPVSVTVLGSQTLTASRIDSGTEIARLAPNVRVSVLGDESQPKFAIRGISTSEFNLNAISSTGVFFDEVYVGASYLGGAQIFDISRVEILRGPQGTLFGKNTTAGAVNFISQAPTFENQGVVSAGYGEYDYFEVKAAGEAPLVDDKLSVRFALNVAHSDGYIENVNPAGRDLSNIDRKGGRLTLAYRDSESGFDATLRLFVIKNDAYAIGAINTGLGPGGTNAFGINPRINPFTGDPLTRHQVATDRSGVIEVRGQGGYLTLNKDLGAVTLTSISSYITGRFLNTVDGDGSIADLLHIDFGSQNKEMSQDLRLSTNGDGPIKLIGGLYYYKDDIDINTNYRLFGGPTGPLAFPELRQLYNQQRRSYAAYIDGTFDLSEALSIYGGLRYTDDKGEINDFQVTPVIPVNPAYSFPRYHDKEPTGRVGARFKFGPDAMIYAQFARGFRSSAFNGGALTNPADLNVARPEKLDSYEAGLKTQLLDRKLTFNTSVFQYNFTNQQFANVVGIGNVQLVNAGRSRIRGLEIETAVRPVTGLQFSAGLGLLDAKYKQLVLNGVDLSGNRLIEAPKYTLNLAGDYAIPIGADGAVTLHGDATRVGSQYFQATNAPEFLVKGFWDVNARIAFREPSGQFEFAVYAKNLTDNRTETGVQTDPNTLTRFSTVPYPRRFGAEVTAHF